MGPEHPPSPDYVPKPEDPEYLVPSDVEAPIKDQPLPDDASPTALSLGYIADSDPEEDPEEHQKEDLADGGDNANDDSSNDNDDNEEQEASEDDDEEEEHLALADSFAIPVVDPVSLAEDTEAFETDESAPTPPPPPTYRTTSRMSVRTQAPIQFPSKAEVARLIALPTLPQSLITPLSSPLPHIPSPLLPLPSPPTTSPTYAEAPLVYRAAEIRLRATSPPTHHPSEIPSPPLLLPSTTHRYYLPEADMPLRKRARFTTPTGRFEVRESSSAAAARAMTAVGVVNDTVTDLATTQRGDVFARWLLLMSVRPLLPDIHGLTLRAGSRPWRPRLELCTAEAGPQDGLEDAGSSYKSRNGNDNHDSGTGRRRQAPPTHECTYSDFLKCHPLNFKGTEGVVGLTQWFKKMESVFHISNYTVVCQIKFATCTMQGNALMWWNSHVKTVTHEVAYAMTWKTLKKMMTDKYCPRGEIKKLEIKMWNLKVEGTDVVNYNQCFQELSLMCSRMFLEESDEIEKYVGRLPDMIHGSVMAFKLKTMQDAIEFATKLMDQKIRTLAERQTENKRKFEDTSRNNQNQQQPFKRHNVCAP
ncbi:putative reverse transcriptase domain-containing protein, partial [Tanacetum coccineum]